MELRPYIHSHSHARGALLSSDTSAFSAKTSYYNVSGVYGRTATAEASTEFRRHTVFAGHRVYSQGTGASSHSFFPDSQHAVVVVARVRKAAAWGPRKSLRHQLQSTFITQPHYIPILSISHLHNTGSSLVWSNIEMSNLRLFLIINRWLISWETSHQVHNTHSIVLPGEIVQSSFLTSKSSDYTLLGSIK